MVGVSVGVRAPRAAAAAILWPVWHSPGAPGGGRRERRRPDPQRNADAKSVALVISANDAQGGKNADEADWIVNYVIPEFTKQMAARGVTAQVTFQPSGVDDEQFKTRLSLDMRTGGGADIVTLDGIWVGEFADAGYVRPLADVVGPDRGFLGRLVRQFRPPCSSWAPTTASGTASRTTPTAESSTSTRSCSPRPGCRPTGSRPAGRTAGRRRQAQGAARGGPDPAQCWYRDGRGATMQGVLPLLAGTGSALRAGGKWQGRHRRGAGRARCLPEGVRRWPR